MSSQNRRLRLTLRFGLIILLCLVAPVAILLTYLNLSIGDSFRQSTAEAMQVRRDSLRAWFDTESREISQLSEFIRSNAQAQATLGRIEAAMAMDSIWWANLSLISGTSLIWVDDADNHRALGKVGGEPPDLASQVAAWRRGGSQRNLVVLGPRIYLLKTIQVDGNTLVLMRNLDLSVLSWLQVEDGTGLTMIDLTTGQVVFSTYPDELALLMVRTWLSDPQRTDIRGDHLLSARWEGVAFNSLGFMVEPEPRSRIMAVIASPEHFNPMVDITTPILIVAIIIILMILVSSILLTRMVISPILALSYAVESLRLHLRQHGPLISIPVRRNDEIGDLALAINELGQELGASSEKIAEQRSEIIAYTHSLEERVQERTRQLEDARMRAEIANQHKSKFLVNMNHELRTPLNAISGITDLLRYGAYEKHEDVAGILEQIAASPALAQASGEVHREIEAAATRLNSDAGGIRTLLELLRSRLDQLPPTDLVRLDELFDQARLLVDDEERQVLKAYSNIHDSGVSLLGIIDEVINLSRIESGVINIELQRIRLSELIAICLVHAEAYAQYCGKLDDFALTQQIDPEVPEFVMLDAQKVKQVVLNLLTNAVKYTDRGRVDVRIGLQVEENRTMLLCSVQDTGRGISDKDRSVMFMEFGRSFEVREIEGTGLGLALSKKLIERHGGAMGYSSEWGRGSTFWFTLPLVLVEPNPNLPGQEQA